MKKPLLILWGLCLLLAGCSKKEMPLYWGFLPMEILENREVVRENVPPDKNHWMHAVRTDDPATWKWGYDRFLLSHDIGKKELPGQSCPILKFSIPIPVPGEYTVRIDRYKPFCCSLDQGNSWTPLPRGGTVFEDKKLEAGKLSLWLAATPAAQRHTRHVYRIHLCRKVPLEHQPVKGYADHRVKERFDRGLAAWELSPGGPVYLSWRLLKEDPEDVAFDLFEITSSGERKCNPAPIRDTTDFTVSAPDPDATYEVRPAAGFRGLSGKCSVEKSKPGKPMQVWKTFRLADPKERIFKVGIGDLDGDGAYDFVVRHCADSGSVDPAGSYWRPSKGPTKLTAFRSDGTRLWTRSLGWNVENGIWYAPLLVADLDGDGKAEVIAKTSDDVDRREKTGYYQGKVISGPEYLTVLDGMTGAIRAQAPWPERSLIPELYSHASRNQLALAYLDGKTPFIIAERGTYSVMIADAWVFRNGKLRKAWRFDNRPLPRKYWGQGAHTTLCMDVDRDGRDEVILGSSVIDDDGTPLWSTGHGHPDRILIAPIQGGDRLLFAEHCETACCTGGVCCHDAATGAMLWELNHPTKHLHVGWFADNDARHRGWLNAATDLLDGKKGNRRRTWTFAPDGTVLSDVNRPSNLYLWGYWDADLQREVLSRSPADYRGGLVGGGYEGSFCAVADVLGDWREEIIAAFTGELRIYATTIPAYDRRVCLMQDKNYRATVYATGSGYLPSTMLSYLPADQAVGFSMVRTAKDKVEVTVSAPLKSGVSGEVRLSIDPKGKIDARPWQVTVKPGQSVTRDFPFRPAKAWKLCGTLRTEDGRERRVTLPLRAAPSPGKRP